MVEFVWTTTEVIFCSNTIFVLPVEHVHHRQEADAKGYKKVNLLLEDALKHPLSVSGGSNLNSHCPRKCLGAVLGRGHNVTPRLFTQ